jgi:glutamate-1-semialdehyde 2,1-aminomutase
MAYGVLLLGHRPPMAVEALRAQVENGTIYGTPHPLEIEFAREFLACVPCGERMLLCNSGTEATMQAIRVMRAYTGKDRIAKFEGAYHGWHDYASWSVWADPEAGGPADCPVPVPASAGIPGAVRDTVLMLPYSEAAFDIIERNASELAGVLVEPVFGGGTIPVAQDYLLKLREVTRRHSVLLLFDEVITGFRLALGGAQALYGVLPDLATYGKIIGGGLPVGAVACSREMMDAVVHADFSVAVAGTFSGNPLTLAAGTAVIRHLRSTPGLYRDLASRGDYLRSTFNETARARGWPAVMTGTGSMFEAHLTESGVNVPRDMASRLDAPLADLQLQLRLNGVFIPWLHLAFLSSAHSDEVVEQVLQAHLKSVEACLAAHRPGKASRA